MKMIYGTKNPAKLVSMRKDLAALPIEVVGLDELSRPVPEVDENGNVPLANAVCKAEAYYRVFGVPVFACDSGLFIEGLSEEEQPGVNVRRVGGKRLSDDEMRVHYVEIAARMGGQCVARYRNGICLIVDDAHVYRYDGEDIGGERFILSAVPHEKKVEGFPLDSLSVHMETGQYYFDMKDFFVDVSFGFHRFFEGVLRELDIE